MGVSCKTMHRDFIGIEMDEEIYNTACERLISYMHETSVIHIHYGDIRRNDPLFV